MLRVSFYASVMVCLFCVCLCAEGEVAQAARILPVAPPPCGREEREVLLRPGQQAPRQENPGVRASSLVQPHQELLEIQD